MSVNKSQADSTSLLHHAVLDSCSRESPQNVARVVALTAKGSHDRDRKKKSKVLLFSLAMEVACSMARGTSPPKIVLLMPWWKRKDSSGSRWFPCRRATNTAKTERTSVESSHSTSSSASSSSERGIAKLLEQFRRHNEQQEENYLEKEVLEKISIRYVKSYRHLLRLVLSTTDGLVIVDETEWFLSTSHYQSACDSRSVTAASMTLQDSSSKRLRRCTTPQGSSTRKDRRNDGNEDNKNTTSEAQKLQQLLATVGHACHPFGSAGPFAAAQGEDASKINPPFFLFVMTGQEEEGLKLALSNRWLSHVVTISEREEPKTKRMYNDSRVCCYDDGDDDYAGEYEMYTQTEKGHSGPVAFLSVQQRPEDDTLMWLLENNRTNDGNNDDDTYQVEWTLNHNHKQQQQQP